MILKLSLSSEKKKQLRRMTMTYHSEPQLLLQFVLFKFRINRIKKTSNRSHITTIAIRYTHLSS